MRALTGASGGADRNAYRYDAFGMQLAGLTGVANPLRYRGERFDAVVNQYVAT